ncbi:MAG TPA: DNA mismatch repair protein MutS [bacterium]|nr:DNA mismatch repair protein MutS [bacterium]
MSRSKKPDTPDGLPDAVIVTDILDLHGFYPEQIPEVVHAFLENARDLCLEQVRIIHGKGKSRLKWEVRQILKGREDVAEFRDAPPESGGWGATLVWMRSDKNCPPRRPDGRETRPSGS